MELNLKRPIAFFDLETTGLNPSHDRIVEMSVLKINVNGDEEQRVWLLNPEMPISAESSSVHGYTDEMVADKPTFREKAKEIALFIGNADLAGYNILKFDLPMLMEEFLRVDYDFDLKSRDFIDVMNIHEDGTAQPEERLSLLLPCRVGRCPRRHGRHQGNIRCASCNA